jgi:hypothetical protein
MPIHCVSRLFLPALLPLFMLAGCGTADRSAGAAPLPITATVATSASPPTSIPTLAPTNPLPIAPTIAPAPTTAPTTLVAGWPVDCLPGDLAGRQTV